MYSMSDERMVNFNKSNPFVIITKNKCRDMESQLVTSMRNILVFSVISFIFVVASTILYFMDIIQFNIPTVNIFTTILNIVISVLYTTRVAANNKIHNIYKTLDAEVNDVMGMNNESLMNLICEIEFMTGLAESYDEILKVVNLMNIILSIVLIFI